MSPGTIMLAPPWPRSGSGNLFAAQAAAHARRGARVLLMLTPLGRGFARHKTVLWQDALSAMCYPGVETVTRPGIGRLRVRMYLQWLRAGRDDAIAISARYAASGRMPAELDPFLASTRVELIHANHVFSMALARRIAGIVQRLQGQRPRIVLETHDIQSHASTIRQKKNPCSRRLDSQDDLQRTELALCREADTLIHLTQADCHFFATHLPDKSHTVVLPTLDPASEAELVRRRGSAPAEPVFLYIGNQHEANLVTVRWLLSEVLPLTGPGVASRIRIVGTIGELLSRRDPELFQRHASLFAGEVPAIFDFYSSAHTVLAPATVGTGTSIKLIEALCVGKPVLATTLGLRGLPAGEMTGADIQVLDAPGDFAAALSRLCGAGASAAFSRANAKLYDRLFSNTRYFAVMDDVLDRKNATRGRYALWRSIRALVL